MSRHLPERGWAAPNRGRKRCRNAAATSPPTPNSTNGDRQSYRAINQPITGAPNKIPPAQASSVTEIARPRCSYGTRSPRYDCIAGSYVTFAIPAHTIVKANTPATGQITTSHIPRPKITIAATMTGRRPYFSDKDPSTGAIKPETLRALNNWVVSARGKPSPREKAGKKG